MYEVSLYGSRAEFDACRPAQVLDGIPSQHKALRTAAYALGGILPFHTQRWAVAKAQSADREWIVVLSEGFGQAGATILVVSAAGD